MLFREDSENLLGNMYMGWLVILKDMVRENFIGKVTFELIVLEKV